MGDQGVKVGREGGASCSGEAFADRLAASIARNKSVLLAGCDPVLHALPEFLLRDAERYGVGVACGATVGSEEALLERALMAFVEIFLDGVRDRVAAVKPNIAFFEQYGLVGLKVFKELCRSVRALQLPLIIDAKCNDIGSTAAAYSATFIGRVQVGSSEFAAFDADAVTVNPFLGFDTLEPFMADCERYKKGIFVLLQTSNPGAKAIQGLRTADGTVSEHVARWLAQQAERLLGSCGWSGLGAVVGSTYPDEARRLRALLPSSYFLIPGLGAQGGGATDAVAGFGVQRGATGGGIVNVSRGLVDGEAHSAQQLRDLIASNADRFNRALSQALPNVQGARNDVR